MRTRITLACTECKQRNYNTTKDKKTHPDRMEIKKYCRFCRTHTTHKETIVTVTVCLLSVSLSGHIIRLYSALSPFIKLVFFSLSAITSLSYLVSL